jgi:hypothetical protein
MGGSNSITLPDAVERRPEHSRATGTHQIWRLNHISKPPVVLLLNWLAMEVRVRQETKSPRSSAGASFCCSPGLTAERVGDAAHKSRLRP